MDGREKRVVKPKREGDGFGISLGARPTGAPAWLIRTDPRLDPTHLFEARREEGVVVDAWHLEHDCEQNPPPLPSFHPSPSLRG